MDVPLEILGNQLLFVEARVGGRPARLALDTAAGIDVLSASLARELGLAAVGTFTGRRMTREALTCDLVAGPAIEVGSLREAPDVVGVHPLFDELPSTLGRVDGALSLRFFRRHPFALDYAAGRLRMGALPEGAAVPLTLDLEEDLALSAFLPARLGDRVDGSFLLDTGASLTVVEMGTMDTLAVVDGDVHEGTNETGWAYRRVVAPIDSIAVGEAVQRRPRICFESIRHDGVIGNDFLQHFEVGIDVAERRMVLRPGSTEHAHDLQ